MIEVYEQLIAEYEEANPNVTIDYQTIPNNEFGTKMLTSLSNGSGPDIINMDDSALRGDYIPKGLLAAIDPAALGAASVDEVIDRYVPGTLAGAQGEDGTLYGLPSEFNGTALAINVAALQGRRARPRDRRRSTPGTTSTRRARRWPPRVTPRRSASSTCTRAGTRSSCRRCCTRPAARSRTATRVPSTAPRRSTRCSGGPTWPAARRAPRTRT